jgi:hypothetical protein
MNKQVLQEVGISAIKSALSNVPLAGTLLAEALFDCRSRIKQERINGFIEKLAEFFSSNPDVNYDRLKTEDFSDLFESVLKRVMDNKSKEKQEHFKNVISGYLTQPNHPIDNSSIFLDLLHDLDEVALIILINHRYLNAEFQNADHELSQLTRLIPELEEKYKREKDIYDIGYANNISTVSAELHVAKARQQKLKQEIQRMEEYRRSEFYGLSDDDFLFYKQLLASKGLLADNLSAGAVGGQPFTYMHTSEFGKRFIDFISMDKD